MRNVLHTRRDQRGMTLIEILVVGVIIAIIIVFDVFIFQ
mgnify:CR=1 FL=1